ncbi:magnesium transporter MgtE N-terminal domain-containing protein [Wenjunlia tyrosinilytica]|uniref:Magnesium transporter n=1 Tax=Wenjunlia tyrosinilytica TaxID=1544741 RepID=A0A917ZMV3_9ACTN|nr:CBS domain-containing protein [Wenjunlia tyrosinilytica]GGO85894.1 magnesium transporter [Wenjunlia tyrosinilytica]
MSSGAPRVFISHLSGVAVFDPNGDQVGRVRDVVAMLRPGALPPRVLGLVVEVVSRRRIFLPMTRVTGVESGQVITTGVLNMRRFEQRPTETLVLGEMLDRRVKLVETGEEVTVLDVAMSRVPRGRDWIIDKVFVRRGKGGPLRRKGETLTVDWSAVTGFSLPEEGQGAANLLATFEQLRPADLANVLHHLSSKRRVEVAAALDDERLADVLEELPEDDQVEIIGKLKDERVADVLEAMDPDDAADLLSELPDSEAERLLGLMEPEEAEPVRRLLSYPEYTAGGMMTTEPIVLEPDETVADALARVRDPDLSPALAAQVYVCRPPTETPTGRYLGIIHFQRLLRDPPFTLVGAMVDDDLQPLPPDTPLPLVTSYLATYNMVAAPVVDEDGHLLGSVTVDDVLDHLLPEDWRESGVHGGEQFLNRRRSAGPGTGREGGAPGGTGTARGTRRPNDRGPADAR